MLQHDRNRDISPAEKEGRQANDLPSRGNDT